MLGPAWTVQDAENCKNSLVFFMVFEDAQFQRQEPLGALSGRSWLALGALLGRLGALLGLSWGVLGRSWGDPGGSWGPPGPLLGRLGAPLGRSWGVLGRPWEAWGLLGRSWGALGAHVEPLLGPFWDPFGALRSSKQ